MLRLNLKIALRYLFKNKLYTFLNIFGLSLGIAAFIIISLYVSYERSYDSFAGSENVYRVYMDYLEGESYVPGDAQTYNLSGPTLKEAFPEITEQVRLYRLDKVTFKKGDKILSQSNGALADETYFDIFNYPIHSGELSHFKEPNTIILSETLAQKLFGGQSPIGQSISVYYESEVRLEVVAVMKDIPQTTHFKTNYLISWKTGNTWSAMDGQQHPNWNQNNFFTYLKLADNIDKGALQRKIIESDFEKDPDERHNIEALQDIHLHSDKPYEAEANGSLSRIRFLTAIAVIIILLSWLNYVNLSSAKSMERAREMGIRKVAGAQQVQLISQSLIESLVLKTIAILIALILVILLLPVFNDFMGKSISFGILHLTDLLPYIGLILVGTVASGLYPAVVMSSFSPVQSLKGKLSTSSSGTRVRKILITLQFFATVILIVGTVVVARQISYLQKQPLGADLSQVVALKGELLDQQSDSLIREKVAVLQGKLKQLSFVNNTARAATYPGDGYDNLSSTVGITFPDGIERPRQLCYIYGAEPDYFDVLDLKIIAGRTYFNKTRKEDMEGVINATFAHIMGYPEEKDIIGKTIKFFGVTCTIVGVVEDYHHFGLKDKIQPMVIGPQNNMSTMLVKLENNTSSVANVEQQLGVLQETWKTVFPQSTLAYSFIDKKFEAQYKEEQRFGVAFQLFTGLAILIAMLGLFGLTSYSCIQRRKEIGIRKVSGASVFQILSLLNKEFIKWVAIAFVAAIPVSYYIMNTWLREFAYRTKLSWWIFGIAGLSVVSIAILTVSFQSLKSAMANPIKSLKTE